MELLREGEREREKLFSRMTMMTLLLILLPLVVVDSITLEDLSLEIARDAFRPSTCTAPETPQTSFTFQYPGKHSKTTHTHTHKRITTTITR